MTTFLTLRPLLQMPFSHGRYVAILEDILPGFSRHHNPSGARLGFTHPSHRAG